MRRVTIRDIAEKVGTSTATVSKVLTGRGGDLISDQMRRKIREAARELGYRPNLAARALATGRTHCIALWAETLADFHAMVANVMLDILRPSRYEMVITDVVKHPDWHSHALRYATWPVDGIIALDSPQTVQQHLDAGQGEISPVVSMGAYYCSDTDHVGVDLATGMRDAILHLYEQGYRRIAHLTCRHGMRSGDARREAYEKAARELELPPNLIVTDQSSREDARAIVQQLVHRGDLPEAVVCFNDEMAIGLCRGLADHNLRVPEDIAVVGCDGIPDTAYFNPSLTTIVQPVAEMCEMAWRFLQNRLEHPDLPRQAAVVKPCLIVRDSSVRKQPMSMPVSTKRGERRPTVGPVGSRADAPPRQETEM